VARPEVLTLHWEGPQQVISPPEAAFADSAEERRLAREREREEELRETLRTRQGSEIWKQIRCEAERRGDEELWRRKLHAYWWVKMRREGTAGDYARHFEQNHATVRTWIADVAKLAYQVGYRLHEDRLVLVGEAPAELKHLRELVNRDAGSCEASAELRRVAPHFRGEDAYFHLNEGHVLRAHGRLRESDETLREGLTIAEARPLRSLLWNARGQTLWDCDATSDYPLRDHLVRAERSFRRAAVLDPSTFFPFVNLAQMAADAGDEKRCEFWMGELSGARRCMSEPMQDALARYLAEAEWTTRFEASRFWRTGPARWLADALLRGVLALLVLACLAGALAAPPASAAPAPDRGADTIVFSRDGGAGGNNSGAGGN
jgi:hypothetical protein